MATAVGLIGKDVSSGGGGRQFKNTAGVAAINENALAECPDRAFQKGRVKYSCSTLSLNVLVYFMV
jgi:hypothetical protein